ncbi:putative PHD type zinc finger protein with BAH domain-containing protein [Puccinia graminis f. sp. tritici]|uniref:Putative PHD type zinc finger protein with BAH domain-containing protein n=1 Tax=Puccinia graminis f. sp. tritici TaxID=56615 RepID=A0A5B0R765_PUCGR|nr:putative PHD type zinc finger protein with BAH domain-containing protein [Puccinia graminis f. sp. tritici]
MTKNTQELSETLELNGEVYAVNDHVYVSSPWHMADGAPWLIGRIMEFIRESLPTGSHKKKKSRPIVQFKLANYHRQRDLNSRHILDCRLLEASMSHEVFCVSRLRGKCKVEFKNDRSSDEIEAWKAAPDCFYFSQVYGRFTHRHYDLILTQNIKNAPPEVVQFLRNNYSYIFAEPGMGAELSEERRGCVTCRQWTTGADSVTCALCGGAYHFACLNPPLIRKPDRGHRWARGYQWACAPCSKKRQESIEDQALALTKESTEESAVATSSSGPAAAASGRSLRDKGKKKEPMVTALVQPGNGPDGVLRTVDGWPFRYYGRFTEPASVLDPMDSPHIYTAPRVGSRHQTMVPVNPSIETGNASSSIQSAGRPVKADKRSRDGTPVNVSCFASTEVDTPRGGDETIDVISTPHLLEKYQDSDLNDYIRDAAQLPVARHVGVTILDGALKTLSEVSSLEEARVKLGEKTIKNLGFVNWTEGDSDKVDKVVSQLGDDLRAIRKAFPKKSGGDITKFFYMFKGHKFPEVSAHDARIDASISHSPDESSCLLPTPSSKRPYTCVVCEVRSAPTWRRCPEALMAGATQAKKSICDECYVRWKKYGLQHVPVAEQEDNHRAKERKPRGPYAKTIRALAARNSLTTQSTSAPVPPTAPPSNTNGRSPPEPRPSPLEPPHLPTPTPPQPAPPPSRVSPPRRTSAGLQHPPPHQNLPLTKVPSPPPQPVVPYPCVSGPDVAAGTCPLCKRVEPQSTMAHCSGCKLACHIACLGLDSTVKTDSWKCLVCQNAESMAVSKILCCSLCQSKPRSLTPQDALSALDVWKLSEYNSFVHMICAVWHAELALTTTDDLTRVEGFATIPLSKRKRECAICHQTGVGVCTRCDQCSNFIHVSCAWSSGYKFGFEILPQRKRRPRESDLVKYAEHNGLMEPRIWCPEHLPTTDRVTYDASDVDPLTQKTALQTFLQHQKDVSADPGLRILRKARRLDSVMDSVTKPKHASPATTLWGKNLDLEDGYMVSALSMLPESLETLAEAPQPAAPTRRRRSSNQGSTVDTAAAVTPATRTRDRTRGRNARNRTRGAPASKEKSDDRSPVTERHDTQQAPSQPKEAMPVDPQLIIPQTQRVPTPVPKPESPRSVAPPATVNNSRPRKVRRKQAKAPSDAVVNANTTPDQPGAIKHPDNLGRSQANGMVLDGQQVAMSTSAPKQNMHQPNGPWRGQAGDTAHASSTSEQSHAVNSVPTGSASKPSPRETAPHVPKPPSKLRLTIKPANAPQKQTNSATPGLMQPKAHEEDRNHVLPAPTFSYLPPPSALNHPHLPQTSRPMSSSSSSSSPSSSKPMMTRLPSINHLDVFHPPISHLHPLPAVSSMSSPMYLPPIASVAQPRRQPPIVTLPPPPPPGSLMSARHPSPGHIPPNHLRFTAPLSTPPSFDAFARGAAPTAAKNPVRRTVPPGTHANPADGPTQSHQQSANGSPPTAPRKNILA